MTVLLNLGCSFSFPGGGVVLFVVTLFAVTALGMEKKKKKKSIRRSGFIRAANAIF